MANIDSATLRKNDYMQAFGNAVHLDGQIALSANPPAGDDIRIMLIPAGTKVQAIIQANDDIDSNGTPTLVHSLGFAPVVPTDGPAANATYFAAAGQTNLQAANQGRVYCNFDPITFDKDVFLIARVGTSAATFTAGNIRAVVKGEARGIK
jgi:hypothetical protein